MKQRLGQPEGGVVCEERQVWTFFEVVDVWCEAESECYRWGCEDPRWAGVRRLGMRGLAIMRMFCPMNLHG